MMDFADSERSTIGLEWELQVVDASTLELAPEAPALVESTRSDLIHGEMHLAMLELVSRKRISVAQCAEDIQEVLDSITPLAQARGLALAGGGSHPFSSPGGQLVSPTARYDELVERTQYWGRQMVIFGTHVHVGIEKKSKVAPISNFLTSKIGHLQALAAASPYWDSIDTGYADNRAMMFQQLPTAGLPHHINSWEELENITDGLIKVGAIREFNEVRWDIRPSPRFGTIEVRACDSGTNIAEVRAVAALIHALVESASRELDSGHPLPVLPRHFIEINKWRSARFGTDAHLVEDSSGTCVPLAESLPALVDWVRPAAEFLGCADDLELLPSLTGQGSTVSRMRAVASAGGTLEGVVAHAVEELQAGHPITPSSASSTASSQGEPKHERNWRHRPIPGNS